MSKPDKAEAQDGVEFERNLLKDAQAKGPGAVLGTFVRLSGPGWLQSAITLGGGSLAGALFLGTLGGTNMLWLQLVAIVMGVIMLSAISYVTLSTGERPLTAINKHINPVLGWGWLIATMMANVIWCLPQFSLCFEALEKNLLVNALSPEQWKGNTVKFGVSAVILACAATVVIMNRQRGLAAKIFDYFLKGLIGVVVICFFGVVAYLTFQGELDWGATLAGFIPDIRQWSQPTGEVATHIGSLSPSLQEFWNGKVITQQRAVMIAAAATAVGINMTFLMPYSLLHRGWDKPFRGLARFDLSTGMAIPYILVTSCVVIASSYAIRKNPDPQFLSDKPAEIKASAMYGGAKKIADERLALDNPDYASLSEDEQVAEIAKLSQEERKIILSVTKGNAFTLSKSLEPIFGERKELARYLFGIGVFGMGFSTIIILMLINGFALCEALGKPDTGPIFIAGCLMAGAFGAAWPVVWDGDAKMWLAVLTSSFGMMLLPIAYVTFFMMMNSKKLLGDEKPTGMRMVVWNVLMGISVLGAVVAAVSAIIEKAGHPVAGPVVIGVGIGFVLLTIGGFVYMATKPASKLPPSKSEK